MGKRMERVTAALEAVGATLKRDKKHRVYALPNGRNFVLSNTPSDSVHAEHNALGDLRRALDLPREVKPETAPKERHAKPGRHDSRGWRLSPMAAALQESGLVEQHLRAQLAQQTAEADAKIANLRRTVFAREERIAELEQLWPVRLMKWWTQQRAAWMPQRRA